MTAHARHQHLDTAADTLRDMITDLTRTRSHRERLDNRPTAAGGPTTHFTKMPPLLDQLQWGDWTKGTDRSGSGYESRPAASLEALDTLVHIDLAAARWVRDLGEDDPGDELRVVRTWPATQGPACPTCTHGSCQRVRRGVVVEREVIQGSGTVACVRLLGGLLPSTHRCDLGRGHEHRYDVEAKTGCGHFDPGGHPLVGWCCTWHWIDHDVRTWWTQARLVTGWDAPAWRPDNTCPNCGERRTLRIRLAERIGFCTVCRETWGPDAYQVLADHIRSESDERARRTPATGPCRCAWPRPVLAELAGLSVMCPRCGTSTCVNAVRSLGRRAG